MANTYTQFYVHVVFAVSDRVCVISSERREELQKYITGIISAQKHKLIAINNMPDHLHLLVGLRPDAALSDLVRDMPRLCHGIPSPCQPVSCFWETLELGGTQYRLDSASLARPQCPSIHGRLFCLVEY